MSTDTIRVHCHDCGSKINAPVKMAGKVASCPKCKATITIPRVEEPPEELDEYQFDVAPPDPPFIPPVPVFEREEDDDDEGDEPARPATARKVLGIDMGAAAFSDAWPNLTSYLILIQIAAAFVAAAIAVTGLVFGVSMSLFASNVDIFHRLGAGILVFAAHCLIAWLVNMIAMAGVELVRVLLQIEANTRKAGAK